MSRKHPYEPNYSGYAFQDSDPDRISSKRDEFGLYYKKHRERGPRIKKKQFLTRLTGNFKVQFEDGSVEKFIINDSETAIRENNEIASDSPLALGAHKCKTGEYYNIPGGKVLLIEKDLDWLEIQRSKRENPYKNVKWTFNVDKKKKEEPEKERKDDFLEMYLKAQKEKKEENKEEIVQKKREEPKIEKIQEKEEKVRRRELEETGLIPKMESSKETDTIDNYAKWKAKKENKTKENNYDVKTIFAIICFVVLIVSIVALIYIVFTGGYRGDNNCATIFECADSQISDTTASWFLLILLTIPYVGFVMTICMLPAFGVAPLILRSIIVLMLSSKTREGVIKVLGLIFK